jgi:hypothetical protein
MIFAATMEQIKEDIGGCNRIDANEFFIDATLRVKSLERWLALMEQLRKAG